MLWKIRRLTGKLLYLKKVWKLLVIIVILILLLTWKDSQDLQAIQTIAQRWRIV